EGPLLALAPRRPARRAVREDLAERRPVELRELPDGLLERPRELGALHGALGIGCAARAVAGGLEPRLARALPPAPLGAALPDRDLQRPAEGVAAALVVRGLL